MCTCYIQTYHHIFLFVNPYMIIDEENSHYWYLSTWKLHFGKACRFLGVRQTAISQNLNIQVVLMTLIFSSNGCFSLIMHHANTEGDQQQKNMNFLMFSWIYGTINEVVRGSRNKVQEKLNCDWTGRDICKISTQGSSQIMDLVPHEEISEIHRTTAKWQPNSLFCWNDPRKLSKGLTQTKL